MELAILLVALLITLEIYANPRYKIQPQDCVIVDRTKDEITINPPENDMNNTCESMGKVRQSYNVTQEMSTILGYTVACCSNYIQDVDSFGYCTFHHKCMPNTSSTNKHRLRRIIDECSNITMFLGNYHQEEQKAVQSGGVQLCTIGESVVRYSCCSRVTGSWQIVYKSAKNADHIIGVDICMYYEGIGDCDTITLNGIEDGLYYASTTIGGTDRDHMDTVLINYGWNVAITEPFQLIVTFKGDGNLMTYSGRFDCGDGMCGRTYILFNMRICREKENGTFGKYFGADAKSCVNCNCEGKCHPRTGKCHGECTEGYEGFNCQSKVCPGFTSQYGATNYTWPRTLVGEKATKPCFVGSLFRVCNSVNSWSGITSNGCESMGEATSTLETLKKKMANSADELDSIIVKLEKYTDVAVKDVAVAQELLAVVSASMDAEDAFFQSTKYNHGEALLHLLQNYAANVRVLCGKKGISLHSSNVNVVVNKIRETQVTFHTRFEEGGDMSSKFDGPELRIDTRSRASHVCTRFNIISFKTSKLFRGASNASVYGAVSVNVSSNSSHHPILHYIIPRDKNDTRTVTCVYWDVKSKNWSTKGVRTDVDDDGVTTCRAVHLTSFSMLLSTAVHSDKDELVLGYITYLGCGISIVGLLPTILIYATFPSLYRTIAGQILLCICVSMLLLNASFLLGSQDSEFYGHGLCFAVAVCIHYFLLSTLMWMAVEAFNMYQTIVVVFRLMGKYFVLKSAALACGLPAAIVLITALISMDTYSNKGQYCLVSQSNQMAFYLGLFTPVCLILLVNTYVFIRVSIIVIRQGKAPQAVTDSRTRVSLTQLRGSMSVMIVLGVTWLLGPMAIGEAGLVFSYLFTILNSFQGFMIFLFQCVMNKEVRITIRHFCSTGKRKRTVGTMSFVKTIKRKLSKRQQDEVVSLAESDISTQSGTGSTNAYDNVSHRHQINDASTDPMLKLPRNLPVKPNDSENSVQVIVGNGISMKMSLHSQRKAEYLENGDRQKESLPRSLDSISNHRRYVGQNYSTDVRSIRSDAAECPLGETSV